MMHPPKFDYYRADSIDEAIALLGQHQGAKLLAGGHSLIPAMNLRLADPGVLIDIGRISRLKMVTTTRNNGLLIGALTTHATLAAARRDFPEALSDAAAHIGDPQVRNRGTVGGNVAHADPASDLPTVFLALRAQFTMVGPNGERTVEAEEFFIDLFTTALEPDEVLTEIFIPADRYFDLNAHSAYVKMANPASRYCMVGAAAVLAVDDGTCSYASVAVGGMVPKATKAPSVEAALVGKALNEENIRAAAAAVANDLGDDIIGDIHGSAEYRRAMAPVYVARALMKAAQA
jgi:carbon-monoxide dehydrogenase medium subunit